MEGKSEARRRTPLLFRVLVALGGALLIALIVSNEPLWIRVLGGAMETAGMGIIGWLAYVSYWREHKK